MTNTKMKFKTVMGTLRVTENKLFHVNTIHMNCQDLFSMKIQKKKKNKK